MRWIEAIVETKSEEIDSLCETLTTMGVQGVSIEDEQDLKEFLENNRQYWDYVDDSLTEQFAGVSQIKFYLIDDSEGWKTLHQIQEKLRRELKLSYVDDENWEYTWRQHYAPIEIGERLLVVPEWMEPKLGERVALRLDPGLAFGTGSHATTRMCLEVLDSLNLKKQKVLDVGFGSGILGIGALVLGAESVTGCDVDPNAPTAARANAALNGIDKNQLKVYAGNILTDEGIRNYLGTGYDLVMANIVADVILSLTGFVHRFMKKDGLFLCSGIIDNRAQEVKTELKKQGFEILRHLHEEEWNCYLVK